MNVIIRKKYDIYRKGKEQNDIHGLVNREVVNEDTTYWASDPIIHYIVYGYAVLVIYDQ